MTAPPPSFVLLLALATLPLLVHSDFWMNFAIMALYFGLIGQGWNILGGYGGQFSFGHAAFFGMGAYAQGVLQTGLGLDPWLLPDRRWPARRCRRHLRRRVQLPFRTTRFLLRPGNASLR